MILMLFTWHWYYTIAIIFVAVVAFFYAVYKFFSNAANYY